MRRRSAEPPVDDQGKSSKLPRVESEDVNIPVRAAIKLLLSKMNGVLKTVSSAADSTSVNYYDTCIMDYKQKGLSHPEIAEKLNISTKTVQRSVKRLSSAGVEIGRCKSGPKPLVTKDLLDRIDNELGPLKDVLSRQEIIDIIQPYFENKVGDYLLSKVIVGLDTNRVKESFILSESDREKRVSFANDMLGRVTSVESLCKLVFSDEISISQFNSLKDTTSSSSARRSSRVPVMPSTSTKTLEKKQNGPIVSAVCSISIFGTFRPVFLHGTLNMYRHKNLLWESLVRNSADLLDISKFTIIQDGSPYHSLDFDPPIDFDSFGLHLLHAPPASADLNPIDECFRIVRGMVLEAKSKDTEKRSVVDIFREIWSSAVLHQLLINFYRTYRLRMIIVVSSKGDIINHTTINKFCQEWDKGGSKRKDVVQLFSNYLSVPVSCFDNCIFDIPEENIRDLKGQYEGSVIKHLEVRNIQNPFSFGVQVDPIKTDVIDYFDCPPKDTTKYTGPPGARYPLVTHSLKENHSIQKGTS